MEFSHILLLTTRHSCINTLHVLMIFLSITITSYREELGQWTLFTWTTDFLCFIYKKAVNLLPNEAFWMSATIGPLARNSILFHHQKLTWKILVIIFTLLTLGHRIENLEKIVTKVMVIFWKDIPWWKSFFFTFDYSFNVNALSLSYLSSVHSWTKLMHFM